MNVKYDEFISQLIATLPDGHTLIVSEKPITRHMSIAEIPNTLFEISMRNEASGVVTDPFLVCRSDMEYEPESLSQKCKMELLKRCSTEA